MENDKSTEDYKEEIIEDLNLARNHFWYLHRNIVIKSLIDKIQGKPLCILELGAGSGNISSYLSEEGYKVAASDFYQSGVAIIKRNGIRAFQYDIVNNLPCYKEHLNAYDIVILGDVIEHLHDPEQALMNARTFLKRNGVIIITVPALPILWTTYDIYAGHKRRYSVKLLTRQLQTSGYNPVKVRYFMFFPGIILLISRKIKSWLIRNETEELLPELSISSIVNAVMKALMVFEFMIQKIVYIPFGSSIYGLASVKDENRVL